MNCGGVVLGPNALYVAVVGGASGDVGAAIWSKKPPGCPYFDGNTTVTVYDDSVQYPSPGVPYTVIYEIPASLPFVVKVTLANSPLVPSNAATLVQNAVIAAFAGTDGGARATIGATAYASRFYAGIAALGPWANIVSILLGSTNTTTASVTATIGAAFTAAIADTVMTVSAVAGGILSVGDTVIGVDVPAGTTISSFGTGSGGTGTYNLSASATVGSEAMTTTSTVLDVTAVASGALAVGQFLFDASGDIVEGTTIAALGTGSGGTGTYTLSQAQGPVASETVLAVVPALTSVPVRIDQVPTVVAACIELSLV
jgi:hypothetical protein